MGISHGSVFIYIYVCVYTLYKYGFVQSAVACLRSGWQIHRCFLTQPLLFDAVTARMYDAWQNNTINGVCSCSSQARVAASGLFLHSELGFRIMCNAWQSSIILINRETICMFGHLHEHLIWLFVHIHLYIYICLFIHCRICAHPVHCTPFIQCVLYIQCTQCIHLVRCVQCVPCLHYVRCIQSIFSFSIVSRLEPIYTMYTLYQSAHFLQCVPCILTVPRILCILHTMYTMSVLATLHAMCRMNQGRTKRGRRL